jgi:hypothetical protein
MDVQENIFFVVDKSVENAAMEISCHDLHVVAPRMG